MLETRREGPDVGGVRWREEAEDDVGIGTSWLCWAKSKKDFLLRVLTLLFHSKRSTTTKLTVATIAIITPMDIVYRDLGQDTEIMVIHCGVGRLVGKRFAMCEDGAIYGSNQTKSGRERS